MSIHNTRWAKLDRRILAAGLDDVSAHEAPEFSAGQITAVGIITAVRVWGGMVWVTIGGKSITQRLLKARLAHRSSLTITYHETVYPPPTPTHGFTPLSIKQCREYAAAFFAPKPEPKPAFEMFINPARPTLAELLNSPYARQYDDGVDVLIARQNAALKARFMERVAAVALPPRPLFLLPTGEPK